LKQYNGIPEGKKLKGKVAIITAAAGAGIGQETARTLAREGASVIVSDAHGRRPFDVAEDIAKTYGTRCLGFQCDVTRRDQVEGMVSKVLDEFKRIDILVNNAGIDRPEPVWEMSDETWDLVMNVNLKGAFYCCRAVIPAMIKQRSGRIVNISSVVAWVGGKEDGAAYIAAKAGIQGFTRALAHQLGEFNITANAVAPGLSFNPFLARVRPPEYFEQIRKNFIIQRDGNPQDIANSILFLVSEEAGYITGECLCVSGGWYMH
jgi:3-oxoacyl-[acyl-carrier protein] reductase